MKDNSIFATAGWLFADLLLVLAILFLVMNARSPRDGSGLPAAPPPTYTPYPTYTPFPTLTPVSTPTLSPTEAAIATLYPTAQVGLETRPAIFYIYPGEVILEKMTTELERYPERVAGFVLVFGYANDVGTGISRARQAFDSLTTAFPEVFPPAMANKPLWWAPDDSGDGGTIRLEVFFISDLKRP